MILLLLAAALAAPPEDTAKAGKAGVTLRYRFEKGLSYSDKTSAAITLDMFLQGQLVQFDLENRHEIVRTVLKVDREGRPLIERVEVLRFVHTVKKHPKEALGDKPYPSQGRTFVWHKKERKKGAKKSEWGLYGERGEVTKKHPQLVAKLKNWRDARLPKKPVKVGDTWEVAAAAFLRSAGQRVPDNVVGKATFRLEEVKGGIARISFTFKNTYRDGDSVLQGANKGEWRFDVARGRDLSFEMKGRLEIDGGDKGTGRFKMTRKVTYSSASRPRGGS